MDADLVREKTVKSAKWAFLNRLGIILGAPAVLMLLPFWIGPGEFGVISILTSVLALLVILQQAGLTEVTVQREFEPENTRNITFLLSFGISIILFLVVFLLSPVIANTFKEPRIILSLRVFSVQLIINGLTTIPVAWWQRNFEFKKIALVQTISSVFSLVTSITFAIIGFGYWAYIIGVLSGAFVKLILVLSLMKWKPVFCFPNLSWLAHLKFGSLVTLESLLGWFFIWFDNIVVGKNLGTETLGIYSLAFNVTTMAVSIPLSSITGVSLSAFSRIQGNPEKLRSAYIQGTRLVSSIAIPAGVGLALISGPLFGVIYSNKWQGLNNLLPILSLYAGFSQLWILNTDVLKSIGRPDILPKVYALVLLIMIPAYIISSFYGILTFTIVRSCIVLVGAFPHTYIAIHYLKLKKSYLWDCTSTTLASSLLMAVVVYTELAIFGHGAGGVVQNLFILASIILSGMIAYALSIRILSPTFWRQSLNLFLSSLGIPK